MNRIFAYLVVFAVLFMIVTMGLGLGLEDQTADVSGEAREQFRVHFFFGVSAALVVVFVNSIVVTYFVGTSRWCKEVVETYRLSRELIARSARLKRRTFPWAVANMLAVVGIVALGGAADPATATPPPGLGNLTWSQFHLAGALLGLALLLYAFFTEWLNIQANQEVINDVMSEVKRVRTERGLDVEEPAK